ncbi:MAG: LysR family transcriptional regulator [Christensenellaceae bacterium]|jgi:DNA-binding transcriptional LysR family regulator|nr:LysR family transcriptional regulator [Christensenellaceae bacterium]
MNLLHLKYAVEVAKAQSISKAAENLYMNQPNLSRAIKELERDLGISIFKRSSKGILVTPQGDAFLHYAINILRQVDEVEALYIGDKTEKQSFSISVPRASYISAAFVEFAKHIDQTKPAEIFYKETNAMRAIDNILKSDYKLGIIRYQQIFDDRFKAMLDEKGLEHELLCEFSYVAVMAKSNPLARTENLNYTDLASFIEIAHADPYVPSLPLAKVKEEEYINAIDKRIFVFERGSQFDLLQHVPNTFMWVSPIPQQTLDKYDLVEVPCKSEKRVYRDVLIYRNGYRLSDLDNLFITEVCKAKRQYL